MHFYKISTKLTVKYENFFLQSSKLTVKYENAFSNFFFYKVQSLQ